MSNNFALDYPVRISNHLWKDDFDPKVSIICKTYMHQPFIRDAIEGFLMQETTFKVEILIHDDASTDGTAEIVKEYEAKYPHLITATCQIENQYRKKTKTPKYIKPPTPRGKYIAKCEGDDYWIFPLKLQTQIAFLESHPEYTLSCGGYHTMDENGRIIRTNLIKKFPGMDAKGFTFTLKEMTGRWLTKTLTVVYRRDIPDLKTISSYKYRRDVHVAYHLIKNGKGFYHNMVFGVYRAHKGGVFSSLSKTEKLDLRYRIYEDLFLKNQDEYTRTLFFNAALSLLIFKVTRAFRRKCFKENTKLFMVCIKTFRFRKDYHRLFKNPVRVIKTLFE